MSALYDVYIGTTDELAHEPSKWAQELCASEVEDAVRDALDNRNMFAPALHIIITDTQL